MRQPFKVQSHIHTFPDEESAMERQISCRLIRNGKALLSTT